MNQITVGPIIVVMLAVFGSLITVRLLYDFIKPTRRYPCPVCRYRNEEPCDNYRICPCCGTEFWQLLHFDYEELRAYWIKSGLKWWSRHRKPPEGWDGKIQLEKGDVWG